MQRTANTVGACCMLVPHFIRHQILVLASSDLRQNAVCVEAGALEEPFGICCVAAGLMDAFGVGSIDLTQQAMSAVERRWVDQRQVPSTMPIRLNLYSTVQSSSSRRSGCCGMHPQCRLQQHVTMGRPYPSPLTAACGYVAAAATR